MIFYTNILQFFHFSLVYDGLNENLCHQKKVLALVLAFACVFTMFAGAASFTDESDIQAKDAVSMLTTLGVIEGYEDDSFQPEGTVTRAEMAKMIFVVRNNTADDKAYANVSTSLTDISGHWAEGYIKFCESQGIIAGKGNGIFDPDATVTGTEAAKMLLVLTGYEADKAGLEGTAWATNTLKHAGAAGILSGVSSALESGLPRQWAAQMIYNTLSASRVIWSNDSQSFDNVLNGGVKETVGRAYMGLYASVGTLVGIDLDEIVLSMNATDEQKSDPINTVWDGSTLVGTYEDTFTKVTTDYSDLLGQKVKVMFKDGKGYQVLGVFATQDNTVYTVAANQTSKSDDKVAFDGNSYRLDGNGSIDTYVDGQYIGVTTLNNLDHNALNPNMYTFVDSDGNGRLDTLVVKTYNVAKVTYADSSKIIAAGQTYKYADENIADDIAKDDWIVITNNLFEDKFDIVKSDVQTATLAALRDTTVNDSKTIYFDDKAEDTADYNAYQIDDVWYNGGEDVVQSVRSENDLNAVKAGESVDYVAVNGIMFYVKKSNGEFNGKVDNVALVMSLANNGVEDLARIQLFNGDTKTVEVGDRAGSTDFGTLKAGVMYEYTVSGDKYYFETLKEGLTAGNEKYEEYYGDLTYRGAAIEADRNPGKKWYDDATQEAAASKDEFDGLTIDDNAEVILFTMNAGKAETATMTGKQYKNLDLTNIDGAGGESLADHASDTKPNGANIVAYAFSGDMGGLDRIGALAIQVTDGTTMSAVNFDTWSHYGFILENAKFVGNSNKLIQYKLLTENGVVTVQEEYNNLDNRQKGMLIGFKEITNGNEIYLRAATDDTVYTIDDVELINWASSNNNLFFDAVTRVSSDSKTVIFAGAGEKDISDATILYVNSDAGEGVEAGSVKTAIKDLNDDYLANAIFLEINNSVEAVIIEQTDWLRSDYYATNLLGNNIGAANSGLIYGNNAFTSETKTVGTKSFADATQGKAYSETQYFATNNIANGTNTYVNVTTPVAGLTVTSAAVANNQIAVTVSGTPTATGTLTFKVKADGVESSAVNVTVNAAESNVVLKTSYDTTDNATYGAVKTYNGTVGYQNAWMLTPSVKVVDSEGTDKSADFTLSISNLALVTDNDAAAKTFTVATKATTAAGSYKIVVTLGDKTAEQTITVGKKTVANTAMTISPVSAGATTSITVTGFSAIGIAKAEIDAADFTLTARVGGVDNTPITVTSASLSSDTLTLNFDSTTIEAGTLSLTVADTANFDFSDTATTVTVS